jgi:disulfide bond formation protein DsbB
VWDRRTPFALALVLGLGLFAGGVTLGAWLHLAACPLCIIQRMLYLMIATVALLGLIAAASRTGRLIAGVLLLSTALTGAFVAGYQSHLQRVPTGVGCAVDSPWWEQMVYWAGDQAPLLFRSSGLCSDPGWKLFGLSIAEYSLIAFSTLALLAIYTLWRNKRR